MNLNIECVAWAYPKWGRHWMPEFIYCNDNDTRVVSAFVCKRSGKIQDRLKRVASKDPERKRKERQCVCTCIGRCMPTCSILASLLVWKEWPIAAARICEFVSVSYVADARLMKYFNLCQQQRIRQCNIAAFSKCFYDMLCIECYTVFHQILKRRLV